MKSGLSKLCSAAVAAGLVASLGAMAPAAAIADDLVSSDAAGAARYESSATESAQPQSDPLADGASSLSVGSAIDPSTTTASRTVPENSNKDQAAGVATIGTASYASLDEALAAAKAGDTIELSQDAQIAKTNVVSEAVTIKGRGHIVAVQVQPGTESGFLDVAASLTFDNAKVTISNPSFWSVVVRSGGSLSFVNGSEASFTGNGVYTYGSKASVNVDASTLTFDGTSYTALMNEYQNGLGYAAVNVKNGSNLTVKNVANGNNGITGFVVNVENSQLHVDDNANQGLVRCTTTFDNSTATISGNDIGITGYRGLDNLTLKNGSKLDMDGNKSAGIFLWGGNVDVQDGTTLSITGTGADAEQGKYTGAICTYYYGADYRSHVTLADGAAVDLVKNPVGAINNGGEMYVGGGTTITGNGSNAENGGGILNTGKVKVAAGARLYNNHAKISGDDIFNTAAGTDSSCGSIAFGVTGDDWRLDTEFGNCGHAIDGWYDDAAGSRWSAHGTEKHVEAVAAGSYEAPLALKAAHGLARVDYRYVGEAPSAAQLPGPDEDLEVGLPYNAKAQAGVDGWTFDGWYTDEACTSKWEDGGALAGSMTLYGKWSKVPAAPAEPTEPTTPAQPQDGQDAAAPQKQAKKSKPRIPQTGDDSAAAALPAALLGAAAVAAAGVAERLRRRS